MQPSGRFLQQGFRAVGIVTDKLTDAVLQIAPEDAPPGTVRAAVVGGLILMSLSFVKGILSVRMPSHFTDAAPFHFL